MLTKWNSKIGLVSKRSLVGASVAFCVGGLFGWTLTKLSSGEGGSSTNPAIENRGYDPTTESIACSAATAWAFHIEKLRQQPDRPFVVEATEPPRLIFGGWHDVQDQFSVYKPTPELVYFFDPTRLDPLWERGPVAIHAKSIDGGPTCVRVRTGSTVLTTECVIWQGERIESWNLCLLG